MQSPGLKVSGEFVKVTDVGWERSWAADVGSSWNGNARFQLSRKDVPAGVKSKSMSKSNNNRARCKAH
jgi:hypothetical protein